MKIRYSALTIFLINLCLFTPSAGFTQTQILKWQDGKKGCVTLTFDDGSINQFRIALPLMNERGLLATFFINTGNIPGSTYQPTFVGRSIQEIVRESATIRTNHNNLFERCSELRYLSQTRRFPEVSDFSEMEVGDFIEAGKYDQTFSMIDSTFRLLRYSGQTFEVQPISHRAGKNYKVTWEELRVIANQGHEFANHTISHPYLQVLDEANILYEIEKCREDIVSHLGAKHGLSIECPYGIEDERVLQYVYPNFPFVRNRITDQFIKEILRGDPAEPVSSDREYVQWQRGPLSETPMKVMKQWIDVTITKNVWLLLVFHGVEDIGWEALPKDSFVEYFDYIKDNDGNLWNATFQDAYKYVRERMHGQVESKATAGTITVTLAHDLNQQVYDLPLTLRTLVPETWKSVQFQQGVTKKNITVQKEGDIAFVQYQAMPNAVNILILKNN
jgi:peptidoglycan/xylan/chitin deacetylase (PgdA/CDA1 family)